MKRILYSTVAKAIAVILLIVCITAGALVVTDGITRTEAEELSIYQFESSFAESYYIENLLIAPQYAILEAYYNTYGVTQDGTPESVTEPTTSLPGEDLPEDSPLDAPPSDEVMAEQLALTLGSLYCADKVNYYVEWNGRVFTNCGATSPEALADEDFFIYTSRDASGRVTKQAADDEHLLDLFGYMEHGGEIGAVTVSASIPSSYVQECRIAWDHQAAIVMNTLAWAGLFALGALVMLIYLVCVCGKTKDGEQRIVWIDYVWSEVHLTVLIGTVVGAVLLYIWLLEEHLRGYFSPYLLYPSITVLAVLATAVILTSLLSLLRSFKARRGIEASLILSVIRWILRGILRLLKWIVRNGKAAKTSLAQMLSRKAGRLSLVLLVAYTLLLLCGVFTFVAIFEEAVFFPLWLAAVVVAFALACRLLVRRALDLEEIQKGVREVRSGNVAHRVSIPKCEELRDLADDVNGVAEGLDRAVADKLKAERMKAELITNVSHDLKTPLTSIINYTELLAQVEGLPEEAKDYVEILSKKNLRLKNLTRDLFDISKVQSGNEEVNWEILNVAVLVEQALGELNGEIQASGLPFCVQTPKELYVRADGRKLSRVVGNLLSNVLKYTLPGTRVFITAAEREGEITVEFKNISAYPLNFDADEIVGRFVRGDESRTTEGSGLGLAIAKSYTELCGGRLEIVLDGDLFKAILSFPAYQPHS